MSYPARAEGLVKALTSRVRVSIRSRPPLPFIPTLIGLRAFDLVSSRVWWEAATNTGLVNIYIYISVIEIEGIEKKIYISLFLYCILFIDCDKGTKGCTRLFSKKLLSTTCMIFTPIGAQVYNKLLPNCIKPENATILCKIRTVIVEIDLQLHRYWRVIESLKNYVQQISRQHCRS